MADCDECRAKPLIEAKHHVAAQSPGTIRTLRTSEETMAGSSSSASDDEASSSGSSHLQQCPFNCNESHLREEDVARLNREGHFPGCCALLLFCCRNQFRSDKGRLPRRVWLTLIFTSMVFVEAYQHSTCHLSWDDDVDNADKLPRQCQTVMRVHDYTELLCKAGLAVVCTQAVLGLVFDGCPSPTKGEVVKWVLEGAPAVAFLIWPGAFWVIYGDSGGMCGEACQQTEAIMEHGCCFVVLMALAATFWDFLATLCVGKPGAVCMFCSNTCLCRHGIEDHIAPSHSWEDCSDPGSDPEIAGARSPSAAAAPTAPTAPTAPGSPGSSRSRSRPARSKRSAQLEATLSWAAFIFMSAVYVAQTWGGWGGSPTVDLTFRVFDTMCHSGICALVVAVVVNWFVQFRERLRQEWLLSVRTETLLGRSIEHVDHITLNGLSFNPDAEVASPAAATICPQCPAHGQQSQHRQHNGHKSQTTTTNTTAKAATANATTTGVAPPALVTMSTADAAAASAGTWKKPEHGSTGLCTDPNCTYLGGPSSSGKAPGRS